VSAGLGRGFEFRHVGRIGTYTCAAADDGRGRVIRCEYVGVGKPPRLETIDFCPACERSHEVSVAWRKPTRFDEGKQPEVIVDGAGKTYTVEPDAAA